MFKLILLLATFASAQYCELVGYEIWAQDKGAGVRGTFLGVISPSTIGQYSIMNTLGDNGSAYAPNSINNAYGDFGDQYGTYSPYNKYSTLPPAILEYRSPMNSYYLIGYLTTSTTVPGYRYNPDDLKTILKYGNCAGCTPKVFYDTLRFVDTLRVTVRDTIRKVDTLRVHDTTKVTVRDTIIKIDSVKYCPAALVRTASGRQGAASKVFDISGRFWATCKD